MRVLFTLFISCFTMLLQAQSLAEMQYQAAEKSPAVQAQQKLLEAALTQVHAQAGLPDPVLSAGYFLAPIETRTGPQMARFSLSQAFPWFGTLKTQKNLAALQAEAALEQLKEIQLKVSWQVTENYLQLQYLRALRKVREDNLRLLESRKDLAVSQFKNDKLPLTSVLRADLAIRQDSLDLALLEKQEKPMLVNLNRLLQRPDTTTVVTPPLAQTIVPAPLAENTNWEHNPRIKLLKLQEETAGTRQKLAEIRGKPKIGAGLDYVVIGRRSGMTEGGANALMPMATVNLPLYRKKYNNNIQQAGFQAQAVHSKILALQDSLAVAAEKLYFKMHEAMLKLKLYKKQINTLEQISKLQTASFANGQGSLGEILEVQRQVLDYQEKEIIARYKHHAARAELMYILNNEEQ